MTTASTEELIKAVRDHAVEQEGRYVLTCSQAFSIAREHGVEVGAIGQLCNREKIKIAGCQLGCFK